MEWWTMESEGQCGQGRVSVVDRGRCVQWMAGAGVGIGCIDGGQGAGDSFQAILVTRWRKGAFSEEGE